MPVTKTSRAANRAWVLVFPAWDEGATHYPLSYVGDYRDGVFTPASLHHVDYGLRHFYAPQGFRDSSGRRIMFGWMQEGRPQDESDRAAVGARADAVAAPLWPARRR